jgi:hypothetical protein
MTGDRFIGGWLGVDDDVEGREETEKIGERGVGGGCESRVFRSGTVKVKGKGLDVERFDR